LKDMSGLMERGAVSHGIAEIVVAHAARLA
jgi:hypothetical protein